MKKTTGSDEYVYVSPLYDLKNGSSTKHIFLPDGTLITSVSEGDSLKYKHLDHLGSTRVVTNTDGMIEQVLDYYPFGEERVNENYTVLDTRYSYTNHEKDDESGMIYMRARYMNPGIARFISQDPASRLSPESFFLDPQQLNMYSYAANSPIMYWDPTGEVVELAAKHTESFDVGVHTFVEISASEGGDLSHLGLEGVTRTTLGAYSEGGFINGNLVKKRDQDTDFNVSSDKFIGRIEIGRPDQYDSQEAFEIAVYGAFTNADTNLGAYSLGAIRDMGISTI